MLMILSRVLPQISFGWHFVATMFTFSLFYGSIWSGFSNIFWLKFCCHNFIDVVRVWQKCITWKLCGIWLNLINILTPMHIFTYNKYTSIYYITIYHIWGHLWKVRVWRQGVTLNVFKLALIYYTRKPKSFCLGSSLILSGNN